MNYFILINNQQQGPFTIDELRTRNITSDTLVWAEGMAQWTPAWQVEELKPLFFGQQTGGTANGGPATPPPPPVDVPTMPNEPTEPNSQDNSKLGSQPLAAAPQQPQKKSKKPLYIAIAVIVIILFILALSNPGQAEHRQAIMQKMDTATEQLDNIQDPMTRAVVTSIMGASQGMIKQVVEELVDSDLEYHNYIFFSTTTLHSDLLEHDIRTSSGFLGHVNAISLSNIIPDLITRQIGISTGDDSLGSDEGNSQEEESTTTTSQDADGNQTTTVSKVLKKNGITVDSLTKKVTNRLADDVAKQVKKEVRQQTDSTTASGIDAIINDVLNFIKGL